MKKLWKACAIAFSMYSRVPMPQVTWNEENMKYAICFFPLVGAVIGGVLYGWYLLCGLLGFNAWIWSAVAAAIPTLVTGGIHMDGFCDTSDALASHQPMERKLEIMKDSHAGAFAIVNVGVYFLLYCAVFTQMSESGVLVAAIGMVLSRTLSGLSVVQFKTAKSSGLAAAFHDAAHKKKVTFVLLAVLVGIVAAAVMAAPVQGSAMVFCTMGTFAYYRWMSYKMFGGITGDVAGYFLVLCELILAYGIVVAERCIQLWN